MLIRLGNVSVALAVAVEPESVTDEGTTWHALLSGPLTLHPSETVPLKPFTAATVRVNDAFFPLTVCDAGDTVRLTSTTCADAPVDVLGEKFVSPKKVAVIVRVPGVVNVRVQ